MLGGLGNLLFRRLDKFRNRKVRLKILCVVLAALLYSGLVAVMQGPLNWPILFIEGAKLSYGRSILISGSFLVAFFLFYLYRFKPLRRWQFFIIGLVSAQVLYIILAYLWIHLLSRDGVSPNFVDHGALMIISLAWAIAIVEDVIPTTTVTGTSSPP